MKYGVQGIFMKWVLPERASYRNLIVIGHAFIKQEKDNNGRYRFV